MMELTGGNAYDTEDRKDEDDFYFFLSHLECQNKSTPNAATSVSDYSVSTFTKKIDKGQVCTKADLPAIKKEDPFMYYSIPAARKSVVLDDAISAAELETSQSHTVRRQSLISFECYSDVLLQNLFDD